MIGPFDEAPFEVFRISPIGIATGKFSGKKRLIVDLSSPHNSTVPSINSLIPLNEFSLRYHDIEQAVELIKIAGHGAWLAKIDITSAFKVMPIHPDAWHLFGVQWAGKFYFAVRLTFGFKSSPKIFDMLSEAICWILSNNYAIPHLIHLLDDFLIISPPEAIPAAHILTVQKKCSELVIPIAQEKTLGPATSIEFLGINLDSVKSEVSLPNVHGPTHNRGHTLDLLISRGLNISSIVIKDVALSDHFCIFFDIVTASSFPDSSISQSRAPSPEF